MAKKKGGRTFGESCIFYGAIFAAILSFGAAVPFVPWRYARVDTNMGDRFVMERRYTLMGLSNNFGKQEGWLSMSKKIQRKVEEFGRPSPLTAILGTVTTLGGVGGAAIGCAMWTICKEHINARYLQYYTCGSCGLAAIGMLVVGAMASGGTVLLMGFEAGDSKKKKKKKKDSFEPATKTMISSIFAFFFPAAAVAMFVCITGSTLTNFKNTAYYPYAGAHVGGFVGGMAAFINWIVMMICMNRVFHFCGKKKSHDSDDEMHQPMMGEYGAYPPPGGYPPPGAYGYGPPPGGGY
jgi:hypothetical protein